MISYAVSLDRKYTVIYHPPPHPPHQRVLDNPNEESFGRLSESEREKKKGRGWCGWFGNLVSLCHKEHSLNHRVSQTTQLDPIKVDSEHEASKRVCDKVKSERHPSR